MTDTGSAGTGRKPPPDEPSPAPSPAAASLRAEVAQAERDEEWALIRVGGWAALLLFIVAVLFLSPWPWGALVGLLFWAMGARGVLASFTEATARTRRLKAALEGSEPAARTDA